MDTTQKVRRKRGEGRPYLRGRIWWIKYYCHGKAREESTHSPKESDAIKLLKKRLGEIALGKYTGPEAERVTVRELAQGYLDDYRVNGKKSFDKAQRMVKRVDVVGKQKDSALMVYFGDYKAHAVTTKHVRQYIAKRQNERVANATINRELAALKRMFNLGIQDGTIHQKPYVPMLREDNIRSRFFEHAEYLAIRNASPDYFKPVVTFAYKIGWRKEEILTLAWNRVDLHAGTVRLDPPSAKGKTKERAGRVIALDDELREMFGELWERRKVAQLNGQLTLICPYVLHHNGKKLADIRDVWAKACKEAGVSDAHFHDFRRTAIRNMVRAGIPERVAMMISGHKTRSVFDRYNIVSEDDLKLAASKVETYVRGLDGQRVIVPLKTGEGF